MQHSSIYFDSPGSEIIDCIFMEKIVKFRLVSYILAIDISYWQLLKLFSQKIN